MLSAWFRQKYPNLVDGALAASAPVWQFVVECDSFSNVTSNAFRRADPDCPKLIVKSWEAINNLGQTKDGLKKMSSIFRLCDTLTDVNSLKAWLNDIYVDTAMANYPYANNFLSPLPAWPVSVMCSNITSNAKSQDDETLLEAIYTGINVYQNYTGSEKCFGLNESTGEVDESAWDFQVIYLFIFFPKNVNMKEEIYSSSVVTKWFSQCVQMELTICLSLNNGIMNRIVKVVMIDLKFIQEKNGLQCTTGYLILFKK